MSASADVMPLLQQGLAELQAGDLAAASATLDRVLAIDPENFDALNLSGVATTRQQRYDDAIGFIERAIAVRPDHAGAYVNLGVAYRSAKRPEAALAAYRKAVELQPAYAAAQFNLASVQAQLNYYEEALASYDRAHDLRPDHAETLVQRGAVLRHLRRYVPALRSIDRGIARAPDESRYHFERAQVFVAMREHSEALAAFQRASELAPEGKSVLGSTLGPKIKICDWTDRDEMIGELSSQILTGGRAMNPFNGLMVLDDPALQLLAARNWSRTFRRATPALRTDSGEGRIRIGYFSADFKSHPMIHLMGQMFSLHDRDRFSVKAFAYNVGEGDEYTKDVRASVDEYIDVDGMSDAEVAGLVQEHRIDVAIDASGYTAHCRTGIFALRAAPVQVNYLGYPGTMGAEFMDYIVADKMIVPAGSFQHYSEKVVWMPDSYSSRDTRVEVPFGAARKDEGLPENAFVFCSFNQSNKITPDVFSRWMDILRRVENSVLWLLRDNDDAAINLQRHAADRGIDPTRLIFAGKRPQLEHLSRIRLADLCLDTLPYNAHTTANDALYVGVPILTLPGETFASRVCASLLKAVGMPDLIATDPADYVEQAVAIAGDPARLAGLRARLADTRRTGPLYDTPRYVRALEAAFTTMHERRLQGLAPDHIAVEL
jgi:protein O-GlcNAc transferase